MSRPEWIFPSKAGLRMPSMIRTIAALCLLVQPFAASADLLAGKLTPGTPYYYENFDPGQRPWKPGQQLNIEEVFKNYQYYEIAFDQAGQEITVNQYVRGDKIDSEKYLVLPDGSLRKK